MRRKKTAVRRPRQTRGTDTVRFILDAVDRILKSDGPAGVTTKRVARIAGVAVGTVYQYFPDRTALLREVERRAWAAELELMLAKIPALRDDSLERTISNVVMFTIDRVAARVASHGITLDDPELRAARFELIEQAEEVLTKALLATTRRFRRAHPRLSVRIAIETAVMLGWVATLHDKEALANNTFQSEVGEMVARYLVADARI